MKLDLGKKRTLELSFEGNTHMVEFPTVRQVKKFNEDMAGANETDIAPAISFLDGLGLPEEVAYELEPDMLKRVVTALCDSKKK